MQEKNKVHFIQADSTAKRGPMPHSWNEEESPQRRFRLTAFKILHRSRNIRIL